MALILVSSPSLSRDAGGPDLSLICEDAAWRASTATGVPVSVLKAISLNETGRKLGGKIRPWPWTVNMEGKGLWFDTEGEARAYVDEHFKRGARSFDVGCFQINYRWHGEAFSSIEEMFDPIANALYAARFLKDLHSETGSWSKAAGAYHSRTPSYAEKYAARFDTFRSRFQHEDGSEIPEIPDIVLVANGGVIEAPRTGAGQPRLAEIRVNSYPLLQTGNSGSLGSLVPIGVGGGTALFGPRSEVN
ncbi:lytic transglycosylase domain-containing protein [Ostreiculturibacter nitratireducens]|uniref:lytic transglycosylase domain-containing protein n=1 Tax=Ostreiculturibacter nitratireducens TaxID=3075226 RepID=UPI0031B56C62